MTGREKIDAAFRNGTPEFGAAICYESLFIRDLWEKFTDLPWWTLFDPDIETQIRWRRDLYRNTGVDWMELPHALPTQVREETRIEKDGENVFSVNTRTGKRIELHRPWIGGMPPSGESSEPEEPHRGGPETEDEIDRILPIPEESGVSRFLEAGQADLAKRMLQEFGDRLFPICHVNSPLWSCVGLWGFEKTMTLMIEHPELIRHAANRFLEHSRMGVRLAKVLGVAGIWIEECMMDMIHPDRYRDLNLPVLIPLMDFIREMGMRSIHYYCGNPHGKWDLLLSTGADALALEEGKKGFQIDIAEAAKRANGRCTLLGNLDAVGMLERADEADLRKEIQRQLEAGRRNGGRFVMSLGSPVTPGTSLERVRLYTDLVHGNG